MWMNLKSNHFNKYKIDPSIHNNRKHEQIEVTMHFHFQKYKQNVLIQKANHPQINHHSSLFSNFNRIKTILIYGISK